MQSGMLNAMEVILSRSDLRKKFEGHGWFGTRFDPDGSNPVSNLISRLDQK